MFERLWRADAEFLVLWLTVLGILMAVAWFVISKVRATPAQQEHSASELMTKFRELHSQGELSDSEFREIKTALAPQIKDELKDNGEMG
ncbi:MAG: hypothetical protein ACOY3P_06690 [Planctomycetota bacterium]